MDKAQEAIITIEEDIKQYGYTSYDRLVLLVIILKDRDIDINSILSLLFNE